MKVFDFRCHFAGLLTDVQSRYVVAATEEEAWQKIEAHFDEQEEKGFECPVYIAGPVVELENIIM